MRDIRRWAVYLAPRPDSALARFGADWLGWDPQAGADRDGFVLPGLPLPRDAITAAPRRYGFHGTLKAPFPLAADREPAAFDAAITLLAAEFAAFALPLRLAAQGPFLALVPRAPSPPLEALAAACVTRLDAFRGPVGPAEYARRRPSALSPAQRALLDRWGYPYVLDEFRFHISLTGPLGDDDRAAVRTALRAPLAPLLRAPVAFADICLFGEDQGGMFHLLKRFALTGGGARR